MRLRNTIILLVILIVLLGIAFYSQSQNPSSAVAQSTPSPSPVPVFQITSDKVSQFQVSDPQKNQTVLVVRQGQDWRMQQPKDSATDPLRVEGAITNLTQLDATRVLTNVTDLGPFGLITPTIEARMVLSDSTQYVIKIGKNTLDSNSSYALKGDDKSTVYLIPVSVSTVLSDFVNTPPYPPTATPSPMPSLTPTMTPTPGGTPSPSPTP